MPRSSLLNIPYEGTRQVEPGNIPVVWQNIHVDPDMFGAGKGRALQQLGGAIGSIGETIGAIDLKNQQEQSDTLVKQADTQLMKEMTEAREEYRNLPADQAPDAFDAFDKKVRGIADRATASVAGNKHAKKVLGNHAEHYYQEAWKFGFGVKTEGVRKSADMVGDKRVDQATERAAVANDEKMLTDPDTGVFSIINGETYSKGQRNRWTEEYTRDIAAERRSLAITKFISNMARGNTEMAQQYRDKYDEHLRPHDKDIIDKQIEAKNRENQIPNEARSDAAGNPPAETKKYPMPPPAMILEPPQGPGSPGHYKQKKSETGVDDKIQLASGGTLTLSAQVKLSPYNKPPAPIPGYHPEADSATVENYIVQQAKLRGIDPGTALKVYQSEGSSQWKSTVPGEPSWGPFQLYTGGGLGNDFQKDTGLDPRNPKTWRENIEYALNKVVEGGWGPWNGAKAKGITGKQGVGEGARVIPVGASNMYKQSEIPEDYGEESSTKVGAEPAKNYGKTYATEVGERDAMSKPGSRITHSYNSYGKIRTLPPDPQLETAIEKAAKDAGVRFNITSGGQTSGRDPHKHNAPGGWTGSVRHNDGRAVDGDITDENGKVLARSDPRRLAFLEAAAKYGAGGTGAGYMDDTLKVHIGITGASGKVGQGLGAYAGNDAERQAVLRGLQGGGHDASTQFAQNGGTPATSEPGSRVKVAAYHSGDTMSDAPQPGYAGAQLAANTGYQPPPSAANRTPITADTTVQELNQRIQEGRDRLRSRGFDEKDQDVYERELKAVHSKALAEKADANKRAVEAIGNEIYGDKLTGRPPVEDLDSIKKDEALYKHWENLTPEQKEKYTEHYERRLSTTARRKPTAEDYERYRDLERMAISDPEGYMEINPYDKEHNLPNELAAKFRNSQITLLKKGVLPDPYIKMTREVLKFPNVRYQIVNAGIPLDNKGMPPPQLIDWMRSEVELHVASSGGKPPSKDDATKMINGLLRQIGSPPKTVFGIPIPLTGSEMREYQVPMTPNEEAQALDDYKKHNPGLSIKTVKDIPSWELTNWRINRREREKTRE